MRVINISFLHSCCHALSHLKVARSLIFLVLLDEDISFYMYKCVVSETSWTHSSFWSSARWTSFCRSVCDCVKGPCEVRTVLCVCFNCFILQFSTSLLYIAWFSWCDVFWCNLFPEGNRFFISPPPPFFYCFWSGISCRCQRKINACCKVTILQRNGFAALTTTATCRKLCDRIDSVWDHYWNFFFEGGVANRAVSREAVRQSFLIWWILFWTFPPMFTGVAIHSSEGTLLCWEKRGISITKHYHWLGQFR